MLVELKVSNFAIIDNLHITFNEGLNVLSGETGAGKSVLLKSLSLLMGGAASSDSIRTGCLQATIEGSFDISNRKDVQEQLLKMGIEADDTLVVRRLLTAGKSKVYLNGSISTLSSLRGLVSPLIEVEGGIPLIEMTGQHDNRNLVSKLYHMDLLDQFSGAFNKRVLFGQKFHQLNSNLKKIKEIETESKVKAQRLDFLVYQRDEIAKLDLIPEEDLTLELELKKLKNSSRISHFTELADSTLTHDDDSALTRLKSVIKKASELSNVDPEIASKTQSLIQAKALIEDFCFELRMYSERVDGDPSRLDQIEGRLSDIRKLQKKHGSSISAILETLERLENEITEIENSDSTIENLKAESAILISDLTKSGKEIHVIRLEGAKKLSNMVNTELLELNMKGVTFHVEVSETTSFTATGTSDVEFMSQTSSRDEKRALAKFASGGELSRILLSLKRVVGIGNQPRTYLFDEVDTGVSGETAEMVGRKLKLISRGQQVICVTHLPQVAAFGDHHYFIRKASDNEQASMVVTDLNKEERVKEIARLISGEKISKTSLDHARQLLMEVDNRKAS